MTDDQAPPPTPAVLLARVAEKIAEFAEALTPVSHSFITGGPDDSARTIADAQTPLREAAAAVAALAALRGDE